jgi:acyl-CoA synthetase (AMP-forming)/AMP-acid ligase II
MLLQQLQTHAVETPNKPFLVLWQQDSYRVLSFSQFHEMSMSLAHFLTERLGDAKGKVVFIVLQKFPLLHPMMIATMYAGAVPSYLPFLTPKQDPDIYYSQHKALFERTLPAAIITYSALAPHIAAIAPAGTVVVNIDEYTHQGYFDGSNIKSDGDDIALLQHSSGTTGLKKGVMLSYGEIERQAISYSQAIGLTRDTCVASWLPLYHDMGLFTSFLIPLSLGASVVAMDPFEWVRDPSLLLRVMECFNCSHTWLPNFAFNHIVNATSEDARFDLSRMRSFISCSEPTKANTLRSFAGRFAADGAPESKLHVCYAMAEASFAVTQTVRGDAFKSSLFDKDAIQRGVVRPIAMDDNAVPSIEIVSNGPPIPGIEVGVLSSQGDVIASPTFLEVGEIVIRGEFVFSGYYKNPDATAAAHVDGWYRTGDLGFRIDEEVYICGRTKDLVIVHGRNYYFHDIEEIVSLIPPVAPGRVVAIGVPDESTGSEEVLILAETRDEHSEYSGKALLEAKRAIKRAVFSALELTPKHIDFVPRGWLHKTTSGKISRADNYSRYIEQIAGNAKGGLSA